MHVNTLVGLMSNQIGFLISELRPLDNLILSRVKHACNQSIELDVDFAFRARSRFSPGGRDGSGVMVAVRKGETKKRSNLFQKEQKMEEAGIVPI